MKKNYSKFKITIILLLSLTNFVKAQTCTASFVYSIGANGYTTFSATAVPSPTTVYSWSFDSGNTWVSYTNTPTTAHTFTANGYYQVFLSVDAPSAGCYASAFKMLIVNTTTYTPVCPAVNPSFTYTDWGNGMIHFTSTSTGAISSAHYGWDFGDGNSVYSPSIGVNQAINTYSANGTYNTTLSVMIGFGPICIYTVSMPVVVTSSSITPCNLNAGFTSNLMAGGVVQFSNTTAGTSSNVAYSWNFGDGSPASSSVSPAHTYTSNGSYTITLTANNNYTPTCISTFTTVVNVNSVCNLNAGFVYTSTTNGEITFTNTSAGTTTNTSYQWSFGDGNTSTAATPSHTYVNSGTYTVSLQANATTNSLFPCVSLNSQSIVITNTCVPNTSFTLQPSGAPQYWYAVVGSTANVVSAEWSWGDGSPNSTGVVTSHTYASAGIYSVCLSVTLSCGATGSYCVSQFMNKSQGENADFVYLNCLTEEQLLAGIGNYKIGNVLVVISPNPNAGNFNLNISGLNSSSANVAVYNLIGEIVYETEFDVLSSQLTTDIKLENVVGGVYFVKVEAGRGVYTQKVIINGK